jgi:uncharacterized protein (TIGR03118 family)
MNTFSLPRSLGRTLIVSLFLSTFAFAQHYNQVNLVSDLTTVVPAATQPTDVHLKNPWGLARSSSSPWWVSDNNDGSSVLFTGAGALIPINPNGIVVVPNAPSQPAPGTPTGVVFNAISTDFLLVPGNSASAAAFIFVTEDGTISGWNPGVNRASAVIVRDHSEIPDAAHGAVYKGATISEFKGNPYLYVANFRSGKVEVYDTNFKRVNLSEERFDDDRIPRDFAPFNVQAIGKNLFVTYAKQDAAKHDPVGGAGLGYVDVFSPSGKLLTRLDHGDWFNAPWGVALTPGEFGVFSHTLLVGNFRSGWIAAINPITGKFQGFVRNPDNSILTIDGLWALSFGNGSGAGPSTTLYFTAGINDENDGLFGTLTPVTNELIDELQP